MTQFFDDMDMSMLVPLDADMVEEALSRLESQCPPNS